MKEEYLTPGPTREAVDRIAGAAVLEFGTDWCGYCRAAEVIVRQALAENPVWSKNSNGPFLTERGRLSAVGEGGFPSAP